MPRAGAAQAVARSWAGVLQARSTAAQDKTRRLLSAQLAVHRRHIQKMLLLYVHKAVSSHLGLSLRDNEPRAHCRHGLVKTSERHKHAMLLVTTCLL